jgi:hypothetical protein
VLYLIQNATTGESMSLNLYQEAIIDAKQLKDVAEQNAKNKIIEALTPQIQLMIEQQLTDEFEEEDIEAVIDDGFMDLEAIEAEEPPELAASIPQAATLDLSSTVVVDDEVEEEEEPDISLDIDGELHLDLESEDEEEEDSDDLLLSREGLEMLESYIHRSRNNKISSRVSIISKKITNLQEAVNGVDFRKLSLSEKKIALTYYGKLLNEVFSLSQSVIIMSESVDERLEYRILGMLKEIKDMSRRKDRSAFRRLFEELAQDEGLREQEEEIAVEDEELEVEEEIPATEEVDVAAATGALEDLGAALGLDVEVEAEGEEEEVEVEEEEGVELELEEGDMEEMYEISETAIRRELRRMRRLREQEEGRAAEADPALAHGGEDEGDVFIDVDEETLLNALADELGDPAVPEPTVESRRRRVRRSARRSRRFNEARSSRRKSTRRASRASVSPALKENVRLKKQLQEMNLFNAKLLFANKLMQNRGLSTKQQRAIVEALDKASTIKEAKLLYQTLSKSLQRRSGRTLSEGSSRLLSSSSRSTRSAAPAKSGVEVDRWAVLAGLNNK